MTFGVDCPTCADVLKAELDQMLQERASLRSDPTPASVIPVSSQLTCACVWIRAAVADAQEKSAGEAMAKVKV